MLNDPNDFFTAAGEAAGEAAGKAAGEAAGLDTCFFTSYDIARTTTCGSASMLPLIERLARTTTRGSASMLPLIQRISSV